ncbi:hypothetical protein BDR05DRAFT_991166 [Suillus weaverae]|nr:hypothetical protein BDR05DRAFT_991166 [Suillus weaverae]
MQYQHQPGSWMEETPEVLSRQIMEVKNDEMMAWVNGVVLLPGGQHIMTCAIDGSIRVWDLDPESGAQIGKKSTATFEMHLCRTRRGRKLSYGSSYKFGKSPMRALSFRPLVNVLVQGNHTGRA